MPEPLLDRILTEIRGRLDASREAYIESQRLTAALDALGQPAARPANPRSTSTPRARPARTRKPKARTRAPRGQNLRLIREAVKDRPGATAGEIASATGIASATVASTLGKLARDSELQRSTLPSGRTGFTVASETPAPAVTEPSSTPKMTAPPPAEPSGNPTAADPPVPADATPASTSDATSAAAAKPTKRRSATTRSKRSTSPTNPTRPRTPSTAVDASTDTSIVTQPPASDPATGDETP